VSLPRTERTCVRCLAGAKSAANCELRQIRQRLRELYLAPRMITHTEITIPPGLAQGVPPDSGLRETSRTACGSLSRSASTGMRLSLPHQLRIPSPVGRWGPLAPKSAMFWNKV
jgi:hypothetical protein